MQTPQPEGAAKRPPLRSHHPALPLQPQLEPPQPQPRCCDTNTGRPRASATADLQLAHRKQTGLETWKMLLQPSCPFTRLQKSQHTFCCMQVILYWETRAQILVMKQGRTDGTGNQVKTCQRRGAGCSELAPAALLLLPPLSLLPDWSWL